MRKELFKELLGSRCSVIAILPLVLGAQTTGRVESSVQAAAAKYVPGINWRAKSVIAGDFSCRGRAERAILGTSDSEIVVAVFLNGLNNSPQVLRYSARVRHAASAVLETESLDFNPEEEVGYALPGFRRSKACLGLNLSDGNSDSAHIYWNHESRRFDDWVR